jgi:branched-subunit amino acid aminotransferase/4-amino-4-deoxychorismate lyase
VYDARMAIIWSGGNWMDESEGFIAMTDRGVLHGMGAFETMLAIDGLLQHAERHKRRLRESIERLGLRQDLQQWDLFALAHELCRKNNLDKGKSRLRLTVMAGEGSLHDTHPGSNAGIWLTAQPLAQMPLEISVVTLPYTRNEQSSLNGLNCCSYAENLVALRWARERGADEGVFFNNRGHLCEACTANVFVKIHGQWLTPSLESGCLPGVMREVVMERYPSIRQADISREEFDHASHMFLTSAIRGVLPVTLCNGKSMRQPVTIASVGDSFLDQND